MRADQRYYNPCALSLLLGRHRPGRLTVLGAVNNTWARYPFFLSDFMAFGEINEIEEFYSCPFEAAEKSQKRKEILASPDHLRLYAEASKADIDCRIEVPSQFETDPLHSEYSVDLPYPEMTMYWPYFLRKMDATKYDTFSAAYEDFLRRHIIVVDAGDVGWYWFKLRRKAWYPNYYQRDGKLDMARYYAMFGPDGGGAFDTLFQEAFHSEKAYKACAEPFCGSVHNAGECGPQNDAGFMADEV